MPPVSYARQQVPPAVIQQAIWLYLRFTLSYREVGDLLAARKTYVVADAVRTSDAPQSHPTMAKIWNGKARSARER